MATAAAPQTTAMVLAREKVVSILTTDEARAQIAPFLRPGVSLERVISTIHQVAAENPEILDCTPVSIVMAVGKGVAWDLEFGETVHLVPFNVNLAKKGQQPRWEKRAKAIRDYKGDIELVKRSGAARHVDAKCVYENEVFRYEEGTHPFIEHHPIMDPTARGKMVGAYAWAMINQRTPIKISVLSAQEIDAIRQKNSKSHKEGPLEPWYACKTMVHQVTKSLPKNPRLIEIERIFAREDVEDIPEGEFEVVAAETPSQSANGDTANGGGANPVVTATPAAAAATLTPETPTLVDELELPDPATLTLEQARKLPLLGPPEAWGGKAGSLLGAFSTGALRQVRKWCVDTIEAAGDDPVKHLTIVAIDLIVADREQQPAAAR
jgi:phage RecT family recombinase